MTENQKLFSVQDLFDNTDKGTPIDITKDYDPLYFWDDFGDKYFKSFKKPQDMGKFVQALVPTLKILNVETMYDAGCGFCRLEPFLLDAEVIKHITAVDISQKQLDCVDEYLKEYKNRDKIEVKKQTIKWSNTPADSYDCVLSVECMQHMSLSSARYAVHEMCKLAKKYVVLIERFVFDGEHPLPYIWSHNYMKLFGDRGMKLLDGKMIGNGIVLFVFEK